MPFLLRLTTQKVPHSQVRFYPSRHARGPLLARRSLTTSSSQVPSLDFSRVLEQPSQVKSAFFCSLCSLSSLMAVGTSIVPGAGAAGVGEARS
eukprot:1992415-Pyramimonas_sp.AAC.1